jgi:hypothetical protein
MPFRAYIGAHEDVTVVIKPRIVCHHCLRIARTWESAEC